MIFTGKDETTARQAAVEHFGVGPDRLTVRVVQAARHGFLGLGRRPAKIEVAVKQVDQAAPKQHPASNQGAGTTVKQKKTETMASQPMKLTPEEQAQEEMAKNHQRNLATMAEAAKGLQEYLVAIYRQLGIKVHAELTAVRAHECEINLVTEQAGQVVGYHGRRLNAVEQLGAAYLNYHGVHDVSLVLDTGDYRARRRESLEKIMERSITQVIATNQAVFLDPMPARERKYLHKLGEKSGQVRTYSHGREPFRSIVIAPKN